MSAAAFPSGSLSLSEYLADALLREESADAFALAAPGLLAVRVEGRVRARASALVAGVGRLGVTPASRFGSLVAKDASGGVLAGIDGRGRVYLAEAGKHITLLTLRPDEALGVAPHALLAAEDSVGIRAAPVVIPAGKPVEWHGVSLHGPGRVAFTSCGEPHCVRVVPDRPFFVRPAAVVAWAAGLTLAGRAGAGDARIAFVGTGFVLIQTCA